VGFRSLIEFMKRINKILCHPDFTGTIKHLETLETDRIYCKHGLSHLLDTARIAALLQYQDAQNVRTAQDVPAVYNVQTAQSTKSFDLELIYAAALLHDIGRVLQYEQNLPHETAGLPLAEKILKDCDFTASEQKLILDAVLFHRGEVPSSVGETSPGAVPSSGTGSSPEPQETDEIKKDADRLRILLHTADRLSRNCFACKASDSCYWQESRKNKGIIV
jgi:uncharacterized protein